MKKKAVYLLIFCLFNFSSITSADEKKFKNKNTEFNVLLECLTLVITVKDQR